MNPCKALSIALIALLMAISLFAIYVYINPLIVLQGTVSGEIGLSKYKIYMLNRETSSAILDYAGFIAVLGLLGALVAVTVSIYGLLLVLAGGMVRRVLALAYGGFLVLLPAWSLLYASINIVEKGAAMLRVKVGNVTTSAGLIVFPPVHVKYSKLLHIAKAEKTILIALILASAIATGIALLYCEADDQRRSNEEKGRTKEASIPVKRP